jgi:hypothetical protein
MRRKGVYDLTLGPGGILSILGWPGLVVLVIRYLYQCLGIGKIGSASIRNHKCSRKDRPFDLYRLLKKRKVARRSFYAFSLSLPAISSWASFTRKLHYLSALFPSGYYPERVAQRMRHRGEGTHLYHNIVGAIVMRCHRLWASMQANQGGKSNSSMLMANMTHATTRPGQMAHVRLDVLYLS